MNKLKETAQNHKHFICIFAFMVLYNFIITGNGKLWKISEAAFTFHAVDYSVGFCTRLLPGAISNLLFHPISHTKITVFETVCMLLVFAAAAFLLEKLYLKTSHDFRPILTLIVFLYVTGSYTFSVYINALGLLDAYWLYFAVIILLLLQKKYLYYFIPFFAAATILIHYSVIISFVPFFVILLLYKSSVSNERKEKKRLQTVTALTLCGCIALFGYFFVFEKSNVKMTMAEFDATLQARGAGDTAYFDEALFYYYDRPFDSNENADENTSSDWSGYSGFALIFKRISATLSETKKMGFPWHVAASAFLLSPLIYFGLKTLYHLLSLLKNGLSKFSVICTMLLFFAIAIFGLLFSLDRIRWIAHAFFLSFTLYLFILYHHGEELQNIILSKTKIKSIPFPVIAAFCIVYAVTLFHPYS